MIITLNKYDFTAQNEKGKTVSSAVATEEQGGKSWYTADQLFFKEDGPFSFSIGFVLEKGTNNFILNCGKYAAGTVELSTK